MAADKSVHERRFEAAVKVMGILPANGPLVPSDDIKVTFYSYYKQATMGPCRETKPSGYNLLAKAKWEAWKALGHMSKEQAMKEYVQEIQMILEIMPVTEEVADLLDILEPFYEVVEDEDEETSKPVISESSSGSGDEELVKEDNDHDDDDDDDDDGGSSYEDLDDVGLEDSGEDRHDISNQVRQDFDQNVEPCANEDIQMGSAVPSACLAQPRSPEPINLLEPSITPEVYGLVQSDTVSFGRGGCHSLPPCADAATSLPCHRRVADGMNTQVAQALLQLQYDMQRVIKVLSRLEAQKLSQVESFLKLMPHSPSERRPVLWKRLDVSPVILGFLLAWPFAVHWLVQLYRQRKR